ncbi:cation:proton antiporter [Candidatus Curtissbacteria bacterium]|nr:cation:proton antiporter [Candidatus Curtissbacteria bacterium]
MPILFLELASVLVLATALGIIARILRQPLILAYIFTGIIISIFGVFKTADQAFLELLSNLGIAFLLFLVGIELKLEDFKYVGKAAFYTGIGQILFTAIVGFVITSTLGFSPVVSLYMAVALTFSSTVIIVKLLAEKHDLNSLYGKVAVGFLLVQDFVAILALMVLSGFGANQVPEAGDFVLIFIKGAILIAVAYLASKYVLKYLFKQTSQSTELLFVSGIAWAFLLSAIAAKMGFSVAIGAFLAGLSIASSPYRLQISARVKPLRDFFIVIFFILLGASMSVGASSILVSHVVILSLFILIGNPLIVLAIMFSLKFRNRTSFLASITVAQISEFSLVLAAVGQALGHLNASHVALVSAVGIVTITLSSYMILYGDKIYRFVERPLGRFFPERARDPYVLNRESLNNHIILVGAEQMGWDILEFLKRRHRGETFLVVDFNPEIIKILTASGYNTVFGDISDPEVLEELELSRAKLLIITDPDFGDTYHLIKFAKSKNYRGPIVAAAYWIHDAVKMYEQGADYVVVPETVGGDHVARVLEEHWEDLGKIKKAKSKNFEDLLRRKVF